MLGAVDSEQGLSVGSSGSALPEKPFWACFGGVKTVSHHGCISHCPVPLPASSLCSTQLWPWEAAAFAHRANLCYRCELRDVQCLSARNNDVPPWKSHRDTREIFGDKLQSPLANALQPQLSSLSSDSEGWQEHICSGTAPAWAAGTDFPAQKST